MTKLPKICRYCQQAAKLLNIGDAGYPYRLDYGPTWTCVPCQAWVGCHKGTKNALGGLANAELRIAKQAAHAAFDPLWQAKIRKEGCSKNKARNAGYAWLATQLGIPVERTHIGYMNLEECRKVAEICGSYSKNQKAHSKVSECSLKCAVKLAEWTGLEPATPGVTGRSQKPITAREVAILDIPKSPITT